MREDFLHYVWRFKKLTTTTLTTEQGNEVVIQDFGQYLAAEGPDFFNAKLRIDGQLWAGNIEMHLKSSDWYAHQHEKDSNYNNVILHIVWEDDVPVYQAHQKVMPTIVLRPYVHHDVYQNYLQYFDYQEVLLCRKCIQEVPTFVWQSWKERLLFERLEEKSNTILRYKNQTTNDWEEVFYKLLLKSFGLNTNGSCFEELSSIVPWKIVQKEKHTLAHLESLFFGPLGFLEDPIDTYQENLHKNFKYLKHKYNLTDSVFIAPQFFKLRPDNFPTIRLAQFAQLIHRHTDLFHQLIVEPISWENFKKTFDISVSEYWLTHYVFQKESPLKSKKMSTSFIELIFINTILPLQFLYRKSKGEDSFETVLATLEQLKAEKNAIVQLFQSYQIVSTSAYDTQALKQLKTRYCDLKQCTSCAVGHFILTKSL